MNGGHFRGSQNEYNTTENALFLQQETAKESLIGCRVYSNLYHVTLCGCDVW
jgi:hypothetical protein